MRTLFLFLFALLIGSDAHADPDLQALMATASDSSLPLRERAAAVDALYEEFHMAFPDTVLHFLQCQIHWAQEAGDALGGFEAEKRKGNILRMQGDYDGALAAYARAEQVAQNLNLPELRAQLANNRGNVSVSRQEYVEATRQFSAALHLYDSLDDGEGRRRVLTSLGSVFVLIDQFDLALKYYNQVWEELQSTRTADRSLGIVSLNLGWCHFQLGNEDKAEAYYRQALDILTAHNAHFFVADVHANWALLDERMGRYLSARTHASTSLRINRELGAEQEALEAQLHLATLAYHLEPHVAMDRASALVEPVMRTGTHAMKRDLYGLLYRLYKDRGQAEQALAMHEQFQAFEDSVAREKQHHSVLRMAYEKEVEQQLAALDLAHGHREAALRNRQGRILLGLGLAFVAAIGGLALFLRRIQRAHRIRRQALLTEIESLRQTSAPALLPNAGQLGLDRERIERFLDRRLNETDWKVLNLLLENPTITNGEMAERAFLSVDGIGSSLRRMYGYFDIQETKYKKIALLLAAMQHSRG